MVVMARAGLSCEVPKLLRSGRTTRRYLLLKQVQAPRENARV